MKPIVDAAVSGIPLLLVVMGLVSYAKSFGLAGHALRVSSMAIGLLLGVGYQISVLTVIPVTFSEWFAISIFGVALGLVASGIYDVGADLAGKVASQLARRAD